MAEAIRFDEWTAELQRLSQVQGASEGFTTFEAAEALGISPETVRRYLRMAAQQGRLKIVGKRAITRIDGKPTTAPAYALANGKAKS